MGAPFYLVFPKADPVRVGSGSGLDLGRSVRLRSGNNILP